MLASWAMDVAKYGLTSIRVPRPFQKAKSGKTHLLKIVGSYWECLAHFSCA